MAIGAATLADLFEPFERGTKLGILLRCALNRPVSRPDSRRAVDAGVQLARVVLVTGGGHRRKPRVLCIAKLDVPACLVESEARGV
jgi:hypothetical protein